MTIKETQAAVHGMAVSKGWWPNGEAVGTNEVLAKLALIHSEVSEAVEEVRTGRSLHSIYEGGGDPPKPCGFAIELADAVIRIMDLCGALGIDLERCMRQKIEYNETRSFRHGGKAA